MRAPKYIAVLASVLMGIGNISQDTYSRKPSALAPAIPKTWDDQAMAALEVPLADPIGSPKHVSADYYYKIPVRPIYKGYPVFAPGHEPVGYMERLQKEEPDVIWDDRGHAPLLRTESDWIKAGQIVFYAAISYDAIATVSNVRDPAWYAKTGTQIAADGTMPFAQYVVRKKGKIELGTLSCGFCHTRVMPDGTVIRGAQGNFAFDRSLANSLTTDAADAKDPKEYLNQIHAAELSLFGVPWLLPDPQAKLYEMSADELASAHEAIPPQVIARHRTSVFYPVQVPDLIGVKDRHYLDRTGLQQQRSIADLMRYAALNQGGDDLASYDGFIPADFPEFKKLPAPGDRGARGRYSDEQLYALALWVYSLQPPPNPNKFDSLAQRGQKVFKSEGCAMCHTPPLYTNNKLTPAEGFSVPADHLKKYDILPISVDTDANLTLKTRRGTGYYKVPSLKGVWYRSMFGHSGWCATLEDWLDPGRTSENYVPTGFKPYGAKTYAVKGHPFGLRLSDEDRKALIAFLKTL